MGDYPVFLGTGMDVWDPPALAQEMAWLAALIAPLLGLFWGPVALRRTDVLATAAKRKGTQARHRVEEACCSAKLEHSAA